MQFQVPQFIEVEDKIFGPLTIRQFIYLAGGAGLCALLYFTLPVIPTFIKIFLMVPIAGFSLALSFYKINNKPFVTVVEAAVMYFFRTKLYIWKKETKKPEESDVVGEDIFTNLLAPKLSDSKLKDLSWSLDVTNSVNRAAPTSAKNKQNVL